MDKYIIKNSTKYACNWLCKEGIVIISLALDEVNTCLIFKDHKSFMEHWNYTRDQLRHVVITMLEQYYVYEKFKHRCY